MSTKYKNYHPKKLIDGAVIGKPDDWYIAIPKPPEGLKNCVFFEERVLIIDNWNAAEAFRKFPDQFGSGFYILGYFKWRSKEKVESEQTRML